MLETTRFESGKAKKNLPRVPYLSPEIDMSRVAVIILGGGQGTRLFPLTMTRCKPAISFGGKYRLIDVPVSNSLNSNSSKNIYRHPVSFHFTSSAYFADLPFGSLLLRIYRNFKRGAEAPYEQLVSGNGRLVRQNIEHFIDTPVDYFLILSGDQLYHMNYQNMLRVAHVTEADLVIASMPINEQHAKRMGVLKVDQEDLVTDFYEKPQDKAILNQFIAPRSLLESCDSLIDYQKKYLGSLGIYLFKRSALLELLIKDKRDDFGKHLIPTKVKEGNVAAYLHNSYWEDIGTIQSFYHANISLTRPNSPFNIYDEKFILYTHQNNLPSSRLDGLQAHQSIICEGCVISSSQISNSIIGPRSVVKEGCIIQNSYVMGNDYYSAPLTGSKNSKSLAIEEGCVIKNTILDKNVHLGRGVRLVNIQGLSHYDGDHIYVRDGIIIVARGASLPEGFVL